MNELFIYSPMDLFPWSLRGPLLYGLFSKVVLPDFWAIPLAFVVSPFIMLKLPGCYEREFADFISCLLTIAPLTFDTPKVSFDLSPVGVRCLANGT